ncbi:GNAT family N-acetyltransferase [Rhizobiales bacterium RZME27]|uniref:Acyl-homoserine-lactone synthase n=1 Tax=Endobacterium cereale TaxID=2663029 RepID=A0A6A8A995_9HYPH|nr:acyl-homoserine-lactone synthase TraI [Endobacterium cereale]MEB2846607.1 acyl-homoserine-lactone synthase TraI [Endobacterium cereale]MQY46468.1 GNAT family N-acetyltransferase [Endobacterium cereale]
MQIIAISKSQGPSQTVLLRQQYQLRADVFSTRLGWDVAVKDGLEFDRFDELDPTYVLALDDAERVLACARLLPALGPTMVRDVFSTLLPNGTLHAHPAMIESSRFCVNTNCEEGRGSGSIHETTLTMFAGIIEWSLINGYTEIVTVTDLRFERILSRVGWPLQRLGPPKQIGVTMAVAGILPATDNLLSALQPEAYRSSFSQSSSRAA